MEDKVIEKKVNEILKLLKGMSLNDTKIISSKLRHEIEKRCKLTL